MCKVTILLIRGYSYGSVPVLNFCGLTRDEKYVVIYAPLLRVLRSYFLDLQMQGTINFSSTYESRTRNVESSVAARGDLWRVEASQGSSTSGNDNSSLFLVQLGPVLFVRDSTLLLPVHLSKQHLLWYGYDRKVSRL